MSKETKESKENIEDDYDIKLKIDEKLFKYKSIKKSTISLKGHVELPQKYKFTSPKLTNNGLYITSIGKAKKEKDDDAIFIWKAKHLNSKPILKFYGTSKIEAVEFSPDEKIFAVLYENQAPIFYNFEDEQKPPIKCKEIEPKNKKLISYCFSKNDEGFAVTTDKDFTIYNVKNGLIYLQVISDDKIKVCRGKTLALISETLNIRIYEIVKWNDKSGNKVEDGKVIFENRHKLKKEFQLTPQDDIGDIITAKISPDYKYLYFITKSGIYHISFEEEEIIKLKIEDETEIIISGAISDDCNIFMTTDMINVKFWGLGNHQNIGYIYKEKFNSFSINYEQSKLLISDDICIDITDISQNSFQQKYIWLDENIKEFDSFCFSPDYKVILVKKKDYAVAYDCSEGNVIRKWKSSLPNWTNVCQMVPETSSIGAIVTKSILPSKKIIIKIWDYLTGTDLSTYKDFDANNFSFSKYGTYLAAGTVEGEEICRAWNLKTSEEYKIFYINEDIETKNKNTFVKIHAINNNNNNEDILENLRVIAVAEDQNPLIFNLKEKQLIMECKGCPIQLSNIYDIQSQELYDLFYIYGKCVNGIATAILFDLNGDMVGEFENCKTIQFSPVTKCLINYSDDVKQNIMTINHLDEDNNINRVECHKSQINSRFLSDGKNIFAIKDIDKYKKKIYFNEVENGEIIGEIDYEKKTDKFTDFYLNLDEKTNCIIFRFIEIQNPIIA